MKFKLYPLRRPLILGFVILFFSIDLMAQRYVGIHSQEENHTAQISFSSPVAYGFAEYVVNPVGHYTGIPQISIPLYTVALKDFSLPVSLSYHAGGIRVDETASNVGLGWTLVAGGMITRSVKDRADDVTIEHCDNRWLLVQGVNKPPIQKYSPCGNGLLWALSEPANANYDGLGSYDINLSAYNGLPNTSSHSMKLLKKFYGVAQFSGSNDIYIMPMADKEPDIFYFNFAGRTGQFVFDMTSGTAVVRTFPYQDLKIEYTTDDEKKLNSFKITDEKGVVYTFSAVEVSNNYYSANTVPQSDDLLMSGAGLSYHVNQYETGYGETEYNSSWFLTKIETPLGQYLDFTYATEAYQISTRGPQQTGWFYMNPAAGSLTYNPNDLTSSQSNKGYYNCLKVNDMTIFGKRLKTIENNSIRIDFLAPVQREDLVPVRRFFPDEGWVEGANSISEMVVYNKIGTESRVKRVVFNLDYFLSNQTERINKFYPLSPDQYDISVTDSLRYFKRLRLRSVQEFGKDDTAYDPPFTFEYKDADFTGFSAHKLPHRLSYQQDLWGYYNGATTNNTLIPSIYVYPDHYPIKDSRQFRVFRKTSYTGSEYFMPAGDRLPNPTVTDIGILTKIIYPSKGHTEYQFESHTFRNEGQDYAGGGLRIKKVTKYDGYKVVANIIHNYSYVNEDNTSSGGVMSLPVMAQRSFPNIYGLSQNSEHAYKTYTVRYSQPQASLGTTNGSFVGYRRVTESIEGNGKKVYTFSMPAAWHVENDVPITSPSGVCDPAVDGHCDGLYTLTPVLDLFIASSSGNLNASNYNFTQNPAAPNTFPFPDNPNYDWQRGHLLSERTWDDNNTLLHEALYTYGNYFPDNQTTPVSVYGYKFSNHYPTLNNGFFPAAHVFRVAKNKVLTEVSKVLKSKKEISYSTTDTNKKINAEVLFDYGNTKLNEATLITSTDSQGKEIENILGFSHDLNAGELGSNHLLDKHIHSIPLRQITKVNDNTIMKKEVSFVTSSGKVVPARVTEYRNGIVPSSKVMQQYDTEGNLQQSTPVYSEDANGIPILSGSVSSYVWGYNSTLPVANIENAKISDVFYTDFEEGDGNSATDDCKSGHKSKTGGFTKSLSGLTDGLYTLSYSQKSGSIWEPQSQSVSVTGGAYQIVIPVDLQVDNVRFYPASARMTTYTYDPGIGMTSMTDTNNLATYYEYDLMNRLHFIRDNNKNIVKEFEYNFRKQ
jgi:hypothetical protein